MTPGAAEPGEFAESTKMATPSSETAIASVAGNGPVVRRACASRRIDRTLSER